jgi:hypothetical protein
MTPTDMLRVQTLARAFEDAMAANPLATFAQAVEALALVAAEKADQSPIGSVNEASWTNASGHLFDLAQVGRLYQDARP